MSVSNIWSAIKITELVVKYTKKIHDYMEERFPNEDGYEPFDSPSEYYQAHYD